MAEKKANESTALGKVIGMVTDKLKERLMDEIEYTVLYMEPPLMDKKGSVEATRLWKMHDKLKADFVNRNSETLEVPPLKNFFD